MDGIEVVNTGRGWGVLETASRGFIRFIDGKPTELFSNAALAWGLAHYAIDTYGSARAAEHRIPTWSLDALSPIDIIMGQSNNAIEDAGQLYAAELHRIIGAFHRTRDLVLSDTNAQYMVLPAPLIGAHKDTAIALWYEASGPAKVTRDRVERTVRLAHEAGYAQVVIYGGILQVRGQPQGGTPWRFVAVHEAERTNMARLREHSQIVLDIARHLPGFRYLGSQFSRLLIGQDNHGMVGIIWRETEPISREEWERAAAEAGRFDVGAGLTLIGAANAAPLDEGWRFIQIIKRSGRWVAVGLPS